jgi:hypothetical protein
MKYRTLLAAAILLAGVVRNRLIQFLLLPLLAFSSLGAGVTASHADTVFDISGPIVSAPFSPLACSGCSIGGTLTINTTTGALDAVDITVTGQNAVGPFNTIAPPSIQTLLSEPLPPPSFNALDSNRDQLAFLLNVASLQGFSGGTDIASASVFDSLNFCTGPGCSLLLWDSTNGGSNTFDITLTAETAATPLPAALPLFATGLGGLGLLGWRRKRKAQAVA